METTNNEMTFYNSILNKLVEKELINEDVCSLAIEYLLSLDCLKQISKVA